MTGSQLKDKVPPHNLDAEQAALGALLLDWGSVGVVIQYLRPEKFYSLQNQKIFTAMLELYNDGKQGDILSLTERLREKGELDAAGGAAYISELTDKVPTSANVEYYSQIVHEQYIRRSLIKTASNIIATAHDDTINSRAILEESQKQIFELTDSSSSQDYKTASQLVSIAIEQIQQICAKKAPLTGIKTGFDKLDEMTTGFQPSEFIVLGARPSIGKTAMALSMIQHIAIYEQQPVAFFSLEMADSQVIQRLIVQESRVNSSSLRAGILKTNDFMQIQNAAGKLYDAPLYIVDTPNMKLLDLRAMARRLKTQHDIKIIFIDYIGLISSEDPSLPRYEQVSEISRSLKSLARELKIPVVALSQVTREAEGKAPSLADLRDSGSIEQDADVVMFLHRERLADPKEESIKTQLILAKQRNGPIGTIELMFIPKYTKFENVTNQEQ